MEERHASCSSASRCVRAPAHDCAAMLYLGIVCLLAIMRLILYKHRAQSTDADAGTMRCDTVRYDIMPD